jgi:hypothetical protein
VQEHPSSGVRDAGESRNVLKLFNHPKYSTS